MHKRDSCCYPTLARSRVGLELRKETVRPNFWRSAHRASHFTFNMLRAAARPLARYSTIRRRPAHLAGTRLYSLDSSHQVTDHGINTEVTPEPGPSNAPSPNSNDEVSSATSGKKSRRAKKLKPKGLPIQEKISSGSSFTQIQMESTASEPTLDDLLALKPAKLPDTTKFDYPERYRKLYEKASRIINRSFTEDQIHGFLKELDPEIQSLPRTKAASTSFLLHNHWNMPPPQDAPLKDRKPRTEGTCIYYSPIDGLLTSLDSNNFEPGKACHSTGQK